jgi:hypothetical protein
MASHAAVGESPNDPDSPQGDGDTVPYRSGDIVSFITVWVDAVVFISGNITAILQDRGYCSLQIMRYRYCSCRSWDTGNIVPYRS